MGRGSGTDEISVAPSRKPASNTSEFLGSAAEENTLKVLFGLDMTKPEASGFSLAEIAEAGFPDEFSLEEREGAYRLIAETADSLVERGLAECSSTTDPADSVRWTITAQGREGAALILMISALSATKPDAS
jgi:hypothetical protein